MRAHPAAAATLLPSRASFFELTQTAWIEAIHALNPYYAIHTRDGEIAGDFPWPTEATAAPRR